MSDIDLTFRSLRRVNTMRCENPRTHGGFGHNLRSWSVAEWTNAMAGEAGEACNIAKKLIRYRDEMEFLNKGATWSELHTMLAEELADVVIYCDLIATSQGFVLEDLIRAKFNKDSERINSPFKLV